MTNEEMLENSPAYEDLVADFCSLLESSLQQGRYREAVSLCRYILVGKPDDNIALFFAVKAARCQEETETALTYLERLLSAGPLPGNLRAGLLDETRQLLVDAVTLHNRLVGEAKLHEALALTEMMFKIVPHNRPFIETALSISNVLGETDKVRQYSQLLQELLQAEHGQIQDRATKSHEEARYEDELSARLELFEHPYDLLLHQAWRLQNIHAALGCIFAGEITAERLQLAERLLAAVPDPDDMVPPVKQDALARFDKFYRLSLREVDLDAIFSSSKAVSELPEMRFADAWGNPLTAGQIQEMIRTRGVQVGFFTAGSQLYFERCALHYAKSILQNCDCSALVFVCATGAWDTAEQAANKLGVRDERLIFCTDGFRDIPDAYHIYTHADIKEDDAYPITLPINYYPSVGLLHLSVFMDLFGIPMFLSGMDTILQKGVAELLDRTKGCDLVVNKSFGTHLSSTYINSLQLIYPTANSRLFASFIQQNLGKAVLKHEQPFAMDQFYLYMGILHLGANGRDVRIERFDEFDVNNCMFGTDTVGIHREHLRKFRFVNIFNMGKGDQALHGSEVMDEAEEDRD